MILIGFLMPEGILLPCITPLGHETQTRDGVPLVPTHPVNPGIYYFQFQNYQYLFAPFIYLKKEIIFPTNTERRSTGDASMTGTATVNYHVHKPDRQALELDADGVIGNLISPDLAATQVRLSDTRTADHPVIFARDSVEYAVRPSSVQDFSGDTWREIYDLEIADLLSEKLGTREVVVFDHTVRIDDPDASRKPARNVHSDYSEEGAKQRLVDVLGPEKAAAWSHGHYAFINIWRPVGNPINSAPLGFVLPASVAPEDWILLDLIYPDRKGQIMGLVGNPDHEWVYRSTMTPEEVAVFNIYDNRGLPSIAHSALDMVEDPLITTIRTSIESRTLVRY